MKPLENQLAEYGQLQNDSFGPITIDEITMQTLGVGRRARHPVFVTNPTAIILSAMAAVLLLIGGIAFLRGGSNTAAPVDEPTTLVPLPAALRQGQEVIKYSNVPRFSGDLVAQDPETGQQRTLLTFDELGRRTVAWAAWSADGRWAAFELHGSQDCLTEECSCAGDSPGGQLGSGLWVTNGLDEPRQLTSQCFDDPDVIPYIEFWEWSPTGAQLVVARQFSGDGALTLIDPATGDLTDLGKPAGLVTSLAWSPDGTRIVYGAVPDANSNQGSLHSLSVEGGDHSLLASSLGRVSGGETGAGILFSPDGDRIAVLAEAAENRLYLIEADGSDLELVTEGVVIEHTLGSPGLMWSHDGTRIAYATFSGERQELQVWNGSPDGSSPILVFDSSSTHDGGIWLAGGPVWSPDGKSIAFRYSTTQQPIWMVADADGTGDARMIDELQYMSWRGGWYFCECFG